MSRSVKRRETKVAPAYRTGRIVAPTWSSRLRDQGGLQVKPGKFCRGGFETRPTGDIERIAGIFPGKVIIIETGK